jgi:hypothetical protein
MGQPGLTHFEPAFADELALMMGWAFEHMQADDGGAVYLRLSTRSIRQVERWDDGWQEDALQGAYWLHEPAGDADAAIVFQGPSRPRRWPHGNSCAKTCRASACSTSPRPICCTADGQRHGPGAGRGSVGAGLTWKTSCASSRPVPDW